MCIKQVYNQKALGDYFSQDLLSSSEGSGKNSESESCERAIEGVRTGATLQFGRSDCKVDLTSKTSGLRILNSLVGLRAITFRCGGGGGCGGVYPGTTDFSRPFNSGIDYCLVS